MADILNELNSIAASADFPSASEVITAKWSSEGVGQDAVRPILGFMESHPDLHYGMPGALVHFMEAFFGSGYEGALLESVRRRPTPHTLWMLNRVINGVSEAAGKADYVAALGAAARNDQIDPSVRDVASSLLEYQS